MIDIRPEHEGDHAAVRTVHTAAFATEPIVAPYTDAVRAAKSPLPAVGFVAVDGTRVVGHVLLTGCRLDTARRVVDIYALSPLGVLPEYQRKGIGTRLVARALAAAEGLGVPAVILEGNPKYYGERGFANAAEAGVLAPSDFIPAWAFQIATTSAYEPWMTGRVVYSHVLWDLGMVGFREPVE